MSRYIEVVKATEKGESAGRILINASEIRAIDESMDESGIVRTTIMLKAGKKAIAVLDKYEDLQDALRYLRFNTGIISTRWRPPRQDDF